jgi:hypothetical protein
MNDNSLPKTDFVALIKESRNVYDTVERCFEGELDFEELLPREQEVYNRIVSLNAICGGRKRFDRTDVQNWHTTKHNIKSATFNRDLALVNKIKGKFRESERELRLSHLIEMAWHAVELAETEGDPEVIARVTKTAWEIEGMKARGNGSENEIGAASEKTRQHFNILIMTERSEQILETIVKSTSVVRHSTPIEEIIAYEELASRTNTQSDTGHSPP